MIGRIEQEEVQLQHLLQIENLIDQSDETDANLKQAHRRLKKYNVNTSASLSTFYYHSLCLKLFYMRNLEYVAHLQPAINAFEQMQKDDEPSLRVKHPQKVIWRIIALKCFYASMLAIDHHLLEEITGFISELTKAIQKLHTKLLLSELRQFQESKKIEISTSSLDGFIRKYWPHIRNTHTDDLFHHQIKKIQAQNEEFRIAFRPEIIKAHFIHVCMTLNLNLENESMRWDLSIENSELVSGLAHHLIDYLLKPLCDKNKVFDAAKIYQALLKAIHFFKIYDQDFENQSELETFHLKLSNYYHLIQGGCISAFKSLPVDLATQQKHSNKKPQASRIAKEIQTPKKTSPNHKRQKNEKIEKMEKKRAILLKGAGTPIDKSDLDDIYNFKKKLQSLFIKFQIKSELKLFLKGGLAERFAIYLCHRAPAAAAKYFVNDIDLFIPYNEALFQQIDIRAFLRAENFVSDYAEDVEYISVKRVRKGRVSLDITVAKSRRYERECLTGLDYSEFEVIDHHHIGHGTIPSKLIQLDGHAYQLSTRDEYMPTLFQAAAMDEFAVKLPIQTRQFSCYFIFKKYIKILHCDHKINLDRRSSNLPGMVPFNALFTDPYPLSRYFTKLFKEGSDHDCYKEIETFLVRGINENEKFAVFPFFKAFYFSLIYHFANEKKILLSIEAISYSAEKYANFLINDFVEAKKSEGKPIEENSEAKSIKEWREKIIADIKLLIDRYAQSSPRIHPSPATLFTVPTNQAPLQLMPDPQKELENHRSHSLAGKNSS